MKHWVIDWSSRQIVKKRDNVYRDVQYVNEHGEHQYIFNQLLVPIHKTESE